MTPISKRFISPKVTKDIYDLLLHSFSKAKRKDDLLFFVSDLLTPTEQIMISKRLAIALLLLRKDYDQRAIANIIKVSTSTVSKVSLVLNTKGKGYRNVLYKVLKDESLKLLLAEIYDILSPPISIDVDARKSYRRFLKRGLKSF